MSDAYTQTIFQKFWGIMIAGDYTYRAEKVVQIVRRWSIGIF